MKWKDDKTERSLADSSCHLLLLPDHKNDDKIVHRSHTERERERRGDAPK